MTSMFGTFRTPGRLSFGAALAALGLVACGDTDDGQPISTEPSSSVPVPSNTGGTVAPSNTAPITPITPTQPVGPITPGPSNSMPTGTGNPTPNPSNVAPMPPNPNVNPTAPVTSGSTVPTSEPSGPTPGATCNITATGEISSKIATVGIVTFTADVPVESAKIEFSNMAGGETFVAPVDVEAENHRTLLLGMKPNATYTYKVIVNDSCSSADGSLTTGNVPVQASQSIPRISKSGSGGMPGFYVVSVYSGNNHSVILDQDGDIVWYGGGATSNTFDATSRSRMDWEGKYMWSIAANPLTGGDGAIRRVSMDGLDETTMLPGTEKRHHDLVAVPGGIMTIIAHQAQGRCSRIIEYGPNGTAKEIVADINTIYTQAQPDCHPNSISYNVDDDTYVVGDRNANMYVKISRDGEVLWQLGGGNPKGASFSGEVVWDVNHGHHLFEQDGQLRFLLFNNGQGGSSYIIELALNENTMAAEELWRVGVASTPVMGDVQRLPNGNTLVALTTAGTVAEYKSGTTDTVQEFKITGGQVGYVDYRPTLYGVPAKARFDYKKFD